MLSFTKVSRFVSYKCQMNDKSICVCVYIHMNTNTIYSYILYTIKDNICLCSYYMAIFINCVSLFVAFLFRLHFGNV